MPVRTNVIIAAVVLSQIGHSWAQQPIAPEVIQRVKKATALVLDRDGRGIGTAFCVAANGYFVTNSHVVNDGDEGFSLVLNPGDDNARKLTAQVVRRSRESDLALLRATDGENLNPLSLSGKKQLVETSTVIAFGFPFGKELAQDGADYPQITVNVARVTALRKSQGALDQIQFDSQLNPGNSGGPVINAKGEVIGVAQSIVLGVTDVGVVNAGINIAIPSRKVDALLRMPVIAVHSVTTPTGDRPLEIEFSLEQFAPFQIRDLNVAIVVDDGGKRTETRLKPSKDNRYRFSTQLPTSEATNEHPTGVLEFADGSIRGAITNAQSAFGDHGFRLGDIASIKKADETSVVRLRSRKEHRLTELPELDLNFMLGGTAISVPIAKLEGLKLGFPRVQGVQARYEIIVRDGDTVVGKVVGRLSASPGLKVRENRTEDSFPLYSPESVASGSTLQEIRRIKATGGVEQILPLPADGWIMVRNSGSQISLLDAESGDVLGTHAARIRFTDMDISPDGSVVYAADYGGERTGYGTPWKPHWVHRFDVVSGEWEVAQAPKIALRVEVVDAETFVLQEGDQSIEISLNRWPAGQTAITELGRSSGGYAGDCEYDPFFGRLVHADSGISVTTVGAFRVKPAGFAKMEANDTARGSSRARAVLSSDGRFFFQDRQQVDARDLQHKLKTFPHVILGATADLALTEAEICDIETAEVLQRCGYTARAVGVSIVGDQVVAHDGDKEELVVYEVRP